MKTDTSELLEKRFLDFGVAVIVMTKSCKSDLPFSVIDQVIRSATSIGANYAEAQNASSRADFKNKVCISKKEAAETRYWLRTITALTNKELTSDLLQEVQEIILILQKIITTLRKANSK